MLNDKQFIAVGAGTVFSLYFLYLLLKVAIYGEIPLGEPNPFVLGTEIIGMGCVSIVCFIELWREL